MASLGSVDVFGPEKMTPASELRKSPPGVSVNEHEAALGGHKEIVQGAGTPSPEGHCKFATNGDRAAESRLDLLYREYFWVLVQQGLQPSLIIRYSSCSGSFQALALQKVSLARRFSDPNRCTVTPRQRRTSSVASERKGCNRIEYNLLAQVNSAYRFAAWAPPCPAARSLSWHASKARRPPMQVQRLLAWNLRGNLGWP